MARAKSKAPSKLKLKKGDEVVVIAGEDRGRRGKVVRVDRATSRVVVEGVNRVKRHQRPTQKNPQGGIVEKELPIHISNVMLWVDSAGKPSRVGRRAEAAAGGHVRVARRTGESLED